MSILLASALLLDVEEFIRQCIPPRPASTVDIPALALPDTRSSTRRALCAALSMLLTFGLNDDIDRVCVEKLDLDRTRPVGCIAQYVFP